MTSFSLYSELGIFFLLLFGDIDYMYVSCMALILKLPFDFEDCFVFSLQGEVHFEGAAGPHARRLVAAGVSVDLGDSCSRHPMQNFTCVFGVL